MQARLFCQLDQNKTFGGVGGGPLYPDRDFIATWHDAAWKRQKRQRRLDSDVIRPGTRAVAGYMSTRRWDDSVEEALQYMFILCRHNADIRTKLSYCGNKNNCCSRGKLGRCATEPSFCPDRTLSFETVVVLSTQNYRSVA